MAFEIQLQLLSATDKRRAQKARQKFNYCDGCGLRAQLAKTFHIVTEKSSAARIPSTQHLPTAKVALENELLKAFYGRPKCRRLIVMSDNAMLFVLADDCARHISSAR